MTRLGFLVSHRGTNMQAVVDACQSGRLPAIPAVVISNNHNAGALTRAQAFGIPAYHLSHKGFKDAEALDQAMVRTLERHLVDWVLTLGYMKKLGPQLIRAYRNRIINIHPSLLPKYGGRGMYGRHVHEAVIAAGEVETGVTIHLVNEEYDQGPILAQTRVPVRPDDTADSLAARVLEPSMRFWLRRWASYSTAA
ncbi:MAG: phosphoribosylglycinamide formyltransferase [Gammaproteobacteria bacterium]|nr:phosphoribosylglycinamide formyltransferase [Gammaproteobacteria bacterium]